MGRVYLAFTPAGRPVALKVVRPDLGGDAEFRRRFRQEVDAARRVHGMYTAQVLDAGPDASPPWLVTAYVPGPSLQEAVARHGPMPEQTVFVLLAGVAEALAAIHAAGIVHRDLKPSNVLLAPDGPRVIDFGIARAADSTALTGTGMLIGSPPFMAPEQIKGHAITHAVDVFALGAVAVFAATGQSAFGDGADMGILYRVMHSEPDLSGCSPRLREVVGRCLDKAPAARPSPAEIIAACRAQTAGQVGGMAPPWLPPGMLAALAQHAPTNAPPWAPMTHAGTAPGIPLAADGPTQGSAAAFDLPGPPTQGSAGAPPWGSPDASEAFPVRRAARRRPVLLGGVFGVIGAAALAVTGVLTLGGHNANSASPGNPGATHSLTAARGPAPTASSPASSSAGTKRSAPAAGTRSASAKNAKQPSTAAASSPASRKRSYAVDSCLVGNWKDAGDVLVNTLNDGQSGQFTGTGGGMEVNAGGGVTQQLGPETLTATIEGNVWAEVLGGSVSMHATTRNGDIIYSDVSASPDAGYKLYENGVYNSSGPMSVSTNPTRYTCSSSTLRLYWSDGTSTYDRES